MTDDIKLPTDLERTLRREILILQERIEGTAGKDARWHAHWTNELRAVELCLSALVADRT